MKFSPAMLTDLYELTMMQGYFAHNKNTQVVFDMFFRRQPFGSGFAIFAGLEPLLKQLSDLQFSKDDIKYLKSLALFRDDFLNMLSGFRFQGDIYAVPEGTVVFANEPLLRVHGSLIETQLIESLLLNTINFQTLIATKTARIYLASNRGVVLEFGLRRAQGPDGALSAARAAYIGGAAATSNTLAGKLFNIPVKGTMAHSWVMAFKNEGESFERYAEIFPNNTILLIDTYDTLQSGLKNAIKVGKKLQKIGIDNFGVRLDSGDLEYLSKRVREKLDKAGLPKAKIAASNELTEEIIEQLVSQHSPIDIWGVGTNLITAKDDPALTGVYKLAAKSNGKAYIPTIKVSNNPEKITNPGIKELYRFYGIKNYPLADLIALKEENIEQGRIHRFYHPLYEYKFFDMQDYASIKSLLVQVMKHGKITGLQPTLKQIRQKTIHSLFTLHETHKRLINPHIYKVSLSDKLKKLKFKLIEQYANR